VHRSRDHDATIRADCVHELGVWFTKHPSYFLESGFLPYLGKTLADQNTTVRLEAVKAILTLYSKKDYIVAVNHFTQTFKPRLIEMAISDIDLSVRLNVVQVLLSIDQLGLLEEEEREQLCLLLFGREPKVREAVAPFVQLTWAEEVDQHLVGRSLTEENADKEKQRAGAKCLAQLLIKWSKMLVEDSASKPNQDGSSDEEGEGRVKDRLLREPGIDKVNHDRIGLAVEALWDEMEFLRKWNALLSLLLMDHTTGIDLPERGGASVKGKKKRPGLRKEDSVVEAIWRLNDAEEEVLLQVLIAALRHATLEAPARKKV
jgi:cohesin complex subunit SA-1/2